MEKRPRPPVRTNKKPAKFYDHYEPITARYTHFVKRLRKSSASAPRALYSGYIARQRLVSKSFTFKPKSQRKRLSTLRRRPFIRTRVYSILSSIYHNTQAILRPTFTRVRARRLYPRPSAR